MPQDMWKAPVLRVRLVPGRVSVFEAVQFVLLLGESGVLRGPEGQLWVAPGALVGAACPPGWTGEKALERFWLRTREGELSFALTDRITAHGLEYREMDLLEFQARTDEFWGLLRSRGVDLEQPFCFADGGPGSVDVPDEARAFVARLRSGPATLRALLDTSPLPDLALTRMLWAWMDQGWVRTAASPATPPRVAKGLRTVVVFLATQAEATHLFARLGLASYQKRRGRHVTMAYLDTPEGRVQVYGVHGLDPETPLLFLQPLIQRAHLVLVAPTVECPRDVRATLQVPCLPLRGEGDAWYLNEPGEDLQAALLRHLDPVA